MSFCVYVDKTFENACSGPDVDAKVDLYTYNMKITIYLRKNSRNAVCLSRGIRTLDLRVNAFKRAEIQHYRWGCMDQFHMKILQHRVENGIDSL